MFLRVVQRLFLVTARSGILLVALIELLEPFHLLRIDLGTQTSFIRWSTVMKSYFFQGIGIPTVFVHVGNDAFSIVLELLFIHVVHMFVQ